MSAREDDAWDVIFALYGEDETTTYRLNSVEKLLDHVTKECALEAAEIAKRAKPYSKPQRFQYFCGVCWRMKERAENGAD